MRHVTKCMCLTCRPPSDGSYGCDGCDDDEPRLLDPVTGLYYHEDVGPGRGPHRTQSVCTRKR